MKLAMLTDGSLGVVRADEIVLGNPPDVPGSVEEVIAGGDDALTRLDQMSRTSQRRLPVAGTQLSAPIRRPGKVVAAPVNYVNHMQEMSEVLDINDLGVFLKASSSVCGPGAVVRLPYHDRRFDQEGELGVVMGREVRNVSEEQALAAVFGYTCLLDITMRGGEDRSLRKSFDSFTPIGPWLVTADEVPDPGSLELRCAVNGTLRQAANTRDLIWSVARLVAYISSVMTLYPGDVIATGTPEGVGPITDGDIVEVNIEAIGSLGVSVSAAGATACPTRGAGRGPVPPPAPVTG